MFGQSTNTSFQTGGSSTPFGQSTSAFGTPSTPFGSSNTTPVNTSFGFGNNANSTPAFGSPSTGTGFGANPTSSFGPSNSSGAGGGFGGFGSTTNSVGFGSNPGTTPSSGLGSTGLFGNTPAPSTGLFGSNNTQPSGGLFGSNQGTSSFGAAAPSTSLFGGGTSGQFGNNTTTTFGSPSGTTQPSSGGMFGQATTSTSSPFGQQQQNRTGTLVAPYQVTNRNDNNISISLHAITAMPQYESKSFEELRLEDYMAGNKGTQQNTSGFGFGAQQQQNSFSGAGGGTGLFGNSAAPTPAFGATSTSTNAFGTTSTNTTFTGGTSTFGATPAAPATGGMFSYGASNTTPAPTPGASGFSFGSQNTNNKPLFGAAPAPTGGLFGSTTNTQQAPAPLFGAAPTTSTFGGFGTNTSSTSTGLFGNTTAAAPSTGLFGASAPSSSLFGAPATQTAPAPLFGSNPSTSSFGTFGAASSPAPSSGLFGAPTSSSGLFGAPATQPAPVAPSFGAAPSTFPSTSFGGFGSSNTTSLFGGASAQPTTSLFGNTFGSTNNTNPQQSFGLVAPPPTPTTQSSIMHPSTDLLLTQQLAGIEAQKKELALLDTWRGNPPSGANVTPSSQSERDLYRYGLSPPSTPGTPMHTNQNSNNVFRSYESLPRSSLDRIQPRGISISASNGSSSTFSSITSKKSSPIFHPATYFGSAASSNTRLVVKPENLFIKPKLKLLLKNDAETKNNDATKENKDTPISDKPSVFEKELVRSPLLLENGLYTTVDQNAHPSPLLSPEASSVATTLQNSSSKKTLVKDHSYEFYCETVAAEPKSMTPKSTSSTTENTIKKNLDNYVPKLTKDGYEVHPTIKELSTMSEAQLAAVSNFRVERKDYGTVSWEGAVDVRDVDLDNVIEIKDREIFVYYNEDKIGTKPPEGTKLNRPAIITLFNIFPKGGKKSTEQQKAKFTKKVESSTRATGAQLITYDPEEGIWSFRVSHFSRYGLLEDSDDDDDEQKENYISLLSPLSSSKNIVSLCFKNQLTPTTVFVAPKDVDDGNNVLVDFGKNKFEKLQAAENAYKDLIEQIDGADDMNIDEDKTFEEESELSNNGLYTISEPLILSDTDFLFMKEVGITKQVAKKCGIKSTFSTCTDFGLKMHNSFRVGGSKNMSFACPERLSCNPFKTRGLVFRNPALVRGSYYDATTKLKKMRKAEELQSQFLPFLETHMKHSARLHFNDNFNCPIFALQDPLERTHMSLLDDYVDAAQKVEIVAYDDSKNVLSRAFQLLSILYGQPTSFSEHSEKEDLRRKKEALMSWLREFLMKDLEQVCNKLCLDDKKVEAIFLCITCGDLSKAVSLAIKFGYSRLSTILASSSFPTLENQLEHWRSRGAMEFIPPELQRLFLLISGDLESEKIHYKFGDKKEKRTFNWEKSLLLNLLYCQNKEIDSIIPAVLSYESDIKADLVPPPFCCYYHESGSSTQEIYDAQSDSTEDFHRNYCLLYRLLLLFAKGKTKHDQSSVSVAFAVSPEGHTPFIHDFSNSFHIAAVIRALDFSLSMSKVEEDILIDSYVSELVSVGLWEWAVYVTLCTSFPTDSTEGESRRLEVMKKAKEIIMRHSITKINHTNEKLRLFEEKRRFLEEKVGIPRTWFEEALAVRYSYDSDPRSAVNHLISSSQFHEALLVIQNSVLPKAIIFGGEAVKDFKRFLENLVEMGVNEEEGLWHASNGCAAMLDLMNLTEEVIRVTSLNLTERKKIGEHIVELSKDLNELNQKIKHDSRDNRNRSLPSMNTNNMTERSVAVTESKSVLCMLERQLNSLLEGFPVIDEDVLIS